MSDRILVPLDGSPLAEQALGCAITLARALPAEIVLLRAVSIPPDTEVVLNSVGLEVATLREQVEEEASSYLREVASELEDAHLVVQQVVRHGPPSETIVDYAAEPDIRQIVMTTHGRTGISRWTHGSVAERVLQAASVPVLMVRAEERQLHISPPPVSLRRILVPLDGSRVAEQVLPSVMDMALALGAEMILFQVPIIHVSGSLSGDWYMPIHGVLETATQDSQAYLDRVAAGLREEGVTVSTAMRVGGVADAIIGYAQANRVDLIAVCTHGRTGLGRWLMGSVADRVLRGSRVPILLVRAS
jgi:nucleotide-binding universal stress UspA family protein